MADQIDPKELLQHQENQHEENQRKLDKLLELSNKQDERMNEMEKKITPMFVVFSNVKNFNSVTVWVLKALILLGAAIGVIYGFFKWIKN